MKCNFCDSEAVSVHRLFFEEVIQGVVNYDYYGEAICTCPRHSISHIEFEGEVVKKKTKLFNVEEPW